MATQPQIQRFKIANPPLDGNDRSYLTSDVSATGTSLALLSVAGFPTSSDSDYYIMIGDYGEEKSEIKLVDASATSGNTLTVAALTFSHSASDPATMTLYNQIRIYGRTTTGGTSTLIGTINIDTTQEFTEFTYEGDTYTYFVTAYYNSTDDNISSYSDEISSSSFSQSSTKKVIESAVRKAMTKIEENPDSELSWDITIDILNDGIDDIMSNKRNWQFLHTIDSSTYSTTSGTAYITLPTDLAHLEHVIINDYKLQWMSRYLYDDYTHAGTTVSSGSPTHYTIKNNKVYLYPTPNSSTTVTYEYYKYPARIGELSDELDREFVPALMNYCAANFAWIRGNDKRGDKMYVLYEKALARLIEEFTGPDQVGDAQHIERTNTNFHEQELGDW